MKWFFEKDCGNRFEIEVGNDDSLQEIKEKVLIKERISISNQTLIFNEIVLDELSFPIADIKDGSVIRLKIAADNIVEADNKKMPDFDDVMGNDSQLSPSNPEIPVDSNFLNEFIFDGAESLPAPPQEISVMLKMPAASKPVEVKADANETIQQLKKKIPEMATTPTRRIVIKHQDGTELLDHMKLHECQISSNPVVTVELRPPSPIMNLHYQMPGSNVSSVLTCVEDTVRQLKEKIHQQDGTPISKISIKNETGMELPDHKTLQDCGISLDLGITVEFPPRKKSKTTASSSSSQPPPLHSSQFNLPAPPTQSESTGSSKSQPPPGGNNMSIVVQYREETMTTVYVNAADKVSELRITLEMTTLQLPDEYFFIHKEKTVKEELSFASQNVADGDVIQIVPGPVTRGDD